LQLAQHALSNVVITKATPLFAVDVNTCKNGCSSWYS